MNFNAVKMWPYKKSNIKEVFQKLVQVHKKIPVEGGNWQYYFRGFCIPKFNEICSPSTVGNMFTAFRSFSLMNSYYEEAIKYHTMSNSEARPTRSSQMYYLLFLSNYAYCTYCTNKQCIVFVLELKMHLGSVFIFSLLSLHYILSYFVILKIN